MKNIVRVILAVVLLIAIGEIAAAETPTHHSIAWTMAVALPAAGGAFSVKEFCKAHAISVAFYYVLRANGLGPREMRAGTRVLVSHEAAADWRRAREVAATHKTNATT